MPRPLGKDILFEKMVPRARLVRAQLINKLIKLINEKKRRIEFGDLTRHGPKGQANLFMFTFIVHSLMAVHLRHSRST